jgi:GntR family transcriptional regulator/MocR family aminotransferase
MMESMKRIASGVSPVIAVNRRAAKPLHRQIYDAFRTNIIRRNLRAGQAVPSTRTLAIELSVSRIPVLNAYAQLLAEGYFESRAGAGTFVSSLLPGQLFECAQTGAAAKSALAGSRRASQRSAMLPRFKNAPWIYGRGAFGIGQMSLEYFPFGLWARLTARHCRSVSAKSLHFGDPMGSLDFRETLAQYLRTARAVNCDAEQIMIVSGSQQALEISARVLLDAGDHVWMEEPGYRLAQQVVKLAGCRVVPVPVDHEGMDVAAGIAECAKARAAFVTPSHQFPLGATMSVSRRLQLLTWAQRADAWIVEDDYDSEYRYKEMPIASLQGLDRNARVIYIGTFSKTLFPALRVGYLVIPPDLVERFVAVRHAMDIYPAQLSQAVLRDFIAEGHFARYVRRTRMLYSERRRALVEALSGEFGHRMEVLGSEAGTHLVAIPGQEVDDRKFVVRAAAEGLWMWPLSPSYLGKKRRHGFVLGYGSAPSRTLPKAVRHLARLLHQKKN